MMATKTKASKKTAAKRAKTCSASRPTRTKAAIAAARGPANSYLYTDAIGEELCRRLADGEPLRSICQREGMPSMSTVIAWALDDTHGFAARYARAREIGFTLIAEEILEICDDSKGDWVEGPRKDGETVRTVDHEAIARARLRVDTRKWMLSKMLPKIYGDKVVNELVGKDGGPVEVKARLDEFFAKLDAIARRQKETEALFGAESKNLLGS
jgi:hypothetical protein